MNICQTQPAIRSLKVLAIAAVIWGLGVNPSQATGPYVRIEQDWDFVVDTPDATQGAPQISIQLEPYPNSPVGGVLLLNYQDTPDVQAGGYQLQLWNGTTNVALLTRDAGVKLATRNEKISFTLFMELKEGNLNFGISSASFRTWSNLPSGGVKISTPYTALTSFTNYYQTNDTLSESGIMLGPTNVKSLKLSTVRKIDATGAADVENPPVPVYP